MKIKRCFSSGSFTMIRLRDLGLDTGRAVNRSSPNWRKKLATMGGAHGLQNIRFVGSVISVLGRINKPGSYAIRLRGIAEAHIRLYNSSLSLVMVYFSRATQITAQGSTGLGFLESRNNF
jgi:hypothetical protein